MDSTNLILYAADVRAGRATIEFANHHFAMSCIKLHHEVEDVISSAERMLLLVCHPQLLLTIDCKHVIVEPNK